MKKGVKIIKKEITYTVDDKLNKLIGKNLAPKKVAEANKMLSNLKGIIPSSLNLGQFTK